MDTDNGGLIEDSEGLEYVRAGPTSCPCVRKMTENAIN